MWIALYPLLPQCIDYASSVASSNLLLDSRFGGLYPCTVQLIVFLCSSVYRDDQPSLLNDTTIDDITDTNTDVQSGDLRSTSSLSSAQGTAVNASASRTFGTSSRDAKDANDFLDALSAVTHVPPLCRLNASGQPSAVADELFPPSPSPSLSPLPWTPSPHRYLLALCVFGRTSNHLLCLRRYAAFAALLNRTLIVPVVKRKGGRTRFSEWVN